MALTKVSGEVITRPLVLTGNASVSGIMTVGIGSTTTTIDGSQDFPTIRPTLDLNFAATKTLDRRITFTRDSIGTYTDEFGIIQTVPNNVPRFDHDPATGESLGLLIEESRTNLFPVSGDATNANWTKLAVTAETDATVTAPDGTLGATKIIQDNTTAQHLIGDTVSSLTLGGYYALSVFVKKGTNTGKIYFSVASFSNWVSDWQFYIDGDTGIVTNPTNVSAAKLKVEQYPNGWWRLSMVAQQEPAGGGAGGFWVGFGEPGGSDVSNFTGDGSSYFYVWGGQMEAGSFATSYIPTSGSAVTRSADNASITGTNFTGFYNTLEGTLYSSFIRKPASNRFFVGLGYNSSNYIAMGYTVSPSNDMYIQPLISSLNGLPSVGGNVRSKSIISYNSSGASGCINGNSVVSETASGGLPSGSNGVLYVGSSPFDTPTICTGTISSVVYYNKRLTNAQLQSLTRQ